MKKSVLLAVVATAALAVSAQAQVCAGFPSSDRGFYFGGRVDFPEDVDSYGVEAAYNASGPGSLFGGLNVVSGEGGGEDVNVFRAGAALELGLLGAMIGPQASICPVAEVNWFSENDVTAYAIPIGVGIGAELGLPVGPSVSGYAVPALLITHGESFGDEETSTDFSIRAGVNVGFGLITVGGEVNHVFEDGGEPFFGIRFGVRL